MIMIVISFALVKFYAFAILYVLIVMQIKLVVVVVVGPPVEQKCSVCFPFVCLFSSFVCSNALQEPV